MCLGVPGQIVQLFEDGDLHMGKVAFGGISKSVCLEHVPEVEIGDYVLVHVGFAIARIDEEEARRVFELLETLGSIEELEVER
jgi:hydrogenase expression/formation protein HypC